MEQLESPIVPLFSRKPRRYGRPCGIYHFDDNEHLEHELFVHAKVWDQTIPVWSRHRVVRRPTAAPRRPPRSYSFTDPTTAYWIFHGFSRWRDENLQRQCAAIIRHCFWATTNGRRQDLLHVNISRPSRKLNVVGMQHR